MKNNCSRLQTCFVRVSKTVLAVLTVITLNMVGQVQAADEYWRTDGASDGTWISNYWNAGSANAAGGTGWTNGNNAVFTANSTLTFATATVGNVMVSANQTVTVTNGGSLTLGAVRTFDVASGAILAWTSQGQSTAAGNEGSGIIKNGDGTLNWGAGPGTNVRFEGGFTINAGTVIVSGDNAFGTGTLTVNGGTLQSSGTRAFTPTSLTVGGDFTLAGIGNATFGMPMNLGSATRTITNSITGSGNSRLFTGKISGGGGAGLTFAGTSALPIYVSNSASDFTGPVTFNGGEVGFASDGSFGAVPGSVTTNAIVIDGGRLTFSETSGNAVTNTINANRGIQIGATAGTAINVAKTNGFLTYGGVIADKPGSAGILVKQGAGTLIVGGTNTYSGGTFVNGGTLQLTNGDNRLPTGTTLNLGQSASTNLGAFDLNGNNQQIAGLNSIAGTNAATVAKNNVINSAATATTLIISNSTTCAYGDGSATNSGIITGAINLIKNGSGKQILGDTNTYTGATTVNAGILALSGDGSIGSSPMIALAAGAIIDVSARTGGTLTLNSNQTLSGFGTMTGILTAANGSTLAPGSSNTTGIFTASGNTTLNGTNIFKLNKTGGTNDALSVGGTLTFGGILNVTNLSGTLAAGDSFKLFNAASYQGSFSITNLPPLNAGLSWTNTLKTDGKLSVTGSSTSVSYLAINSISLSGTNLVIGGTNQGAGTYYVLASTNAALPKTNWTAIATNVLGGSGNFTLTATNVVNSHAAQMFYILGTTNNH